MLTVEKRHQDHLWILTLNDSSKEAVDAWETTVREYIKTFNHHPQRYLIYDTTRARNLGFTTYLRDRATVLARDNRDATGRVAIVLRLPEVIARMFEFFVRYQGRRLQPDLEVRLFNQLDQAIAWVEAIVPQELKETTEAVAKSGSI